MLRIGAPSLHGRLARRMPADCREPRGPDAALDVARQQTTDAPASPRVAWRSDAAPRAAYPWNACCVPWLSELFSAPVLQRILDKRRHERLAAVAYFEGLMTGEIDALIGAFAGEPELHHAVRGRITSAPALGRFMRHPSTAKRGA